MLIKPLYFDQLTGQIIEAQAGDVLASNVIATQIVETYATLLNTVPINTCCAFVDENAMLVSSLGTTDTTFRPLPFVDCVILESGVLGESVRVANQYGRLYYTPIAIEYTSTSGILYLGKDGLLTGTVPSTVNGDRYKVIVGRLKNTNEFIFAPEIPIDLLTGSRTGDLPIGQVFKGDYLYTDGNTWYPKKINQTDVEVAPGINTFISTSSILEVGESVIPTFSATFSRTPSSLSLANSLTGIAESLAVSSSFASSQTFSLALPGSVTFSLIASFPTIAVATLQLLWVKRIYYGHQTSFGSVTDLQSNKLTTSFKSSYTIDAAPNEYIYFAIPTDYINPVFSVGGMQGGLDFIETISHTNTYGISVSYNIYKTENHSLGAIVVVLS